ncbi:MAG: glycosyltransferase [Lachnospiraceae bacterium]|nr:glycosyltransferase [Lachnospiraceae bacterium]
MKEPLVSWLMPVYNAGNSLSVAMESMLNQTYGNTEIVIINDCSSDDSGNILKRYAKQNPQIRVYENEKNMGVALSLNRGLKLCRGKYIARMDADDFSYPERIKKQVEFMETNEDVGILGSGICEINSEKNLRIKRFYPTDSEELRCRLLFNIQAVHPTIMFRASVIKDFNIEYPNSPAEDYALFASLIFKVKMANLKAILLDYYVENDNQVTTLSKQKILADNKEISKRTIRDTLGIDVSKYSFFLFGTRNRDLVPYGAGKTLAEAEEFFNELIKENGRRNVFNPVILEKQLNDELNGIKSKIHVKSFKEVVQKHILEVLDDEGADSESFVPYPEGKVIIYGTGDYASEYVPYIESKAAYEIVAFCDSKKEKQGRMFLGKKVIGPNELSKIGYDFILIATPVYYTEILDMLVNEYGVSESRIIDFRHICDIKAINDRKEWKKEYRHDGSKRKLFMFCAPDYANLGDHAIAYAEKKFIREKLGMDVVEVPTRRYEEAANIARHNINSDDLLLITGGGFLGSLWMNPESMTRRIIDEYPENRIIVMPQTLYWGGSATQQREAQYTRSIYQKHKRLTLFARDGVSFELMKQYYPECDIHQAPDMVLSVDWDEFIREDAKKQGLLLCLKSDKESILSAAQKQELVEIGERRVGSVTCNNNMHSHVILEPFARYGALSEHLLKFQQARICVTDRLHGMLFCVITGTPCVVLNSCNHKLTEGYRWVKELQYIKFAKDVSEVDECIQGLSEIKAPKYDASMFRSRYEELAAILKENLCDSM